MMDGAIVSNNKDQAEQWFKENNLDIFKFRQELYEREEQVEFKPGTMLLYRLDAWHRGTTLNDGTSPDGYFKIFGTKKLFFEF